MLFPPYTSHELHWKQLPSSWSPRNLKAYRPAKANIHTLRPMLTQKSTQRAMDCFFNDCSCDDPTCTLLLFKLLYLWGDVKCSNLTLLRALFWSLMYGAATPHSVILVSWTSSNHYALYSVKCSTLSTKYLILWNTAGFNSNVIIHICHKQSTWEKKKQRSWC